MSEIRQAVVTGAGGFLGSRMVKLLEKDGWHVLAVHRRPTAGKNTIHADLTRAGALDRHVTLRSVIFHLAGRGNVSRSIADPVGDFIDNVPMALNLLETARISTSTLILASTGSVYDQTVPIPFSEDGPVRPLSPYGATRLAIEEYGLAYLHSYGLDVRIARQFSIYGPGMRSLAIHDFVERLKRDPERLSIRGDGKQIRDYLYVDDAARALAIIADRGSPGQIYNVGSGTATAIGDLAAKTATTMGFPNCDVVPDDAETEGELSHMLADTTKLAALGFRPQILFEDGLAKTVAALTKTGTKKRVTTNKALTDATPSPDRIA